MIEIEIANLKIICQFHAHSVHQNSVEIFWAEIYRGRLYFRAAIYRGRLLTLITGSSSRLLRIRFSADLTMYWFPVYHFRCMKFKPLVIWIWYQNIAISTIVGTSSHIKRVFSLFLCVCSLFPSIINYACPNFQKYKRNGTDVYTSSWVWALNVSFNPSNGHVGGISSFV
jgi:hypothetical protein